MRWIKVAAAVLNQTPLAWDHNQRNVLAAIDRAQEERVGLLCLPELCLTGYGCEDAYASPGVQAQALELLRAVAPATRGMVVTLGLPLLWRKALFNTACVLADGKIAGFVAKQHLAGDGLYYEPRWFKPWPEGKRAEVEIDGARYPLGDLVFNCGGVRIGFEICEDAWVSSRPGSRLSERGVDVLLNPSASHFAFGKQEVRERFVLEGARAFATSYVYSNLLGNDAGRTVYDGGALIASGTKLLARGPRFSFADFDLTTAVVDVDWTRMLQTRTGSFRPCFDLEPGEEVEIDFRIPDAEPEPPDSRPSAWEGGPHEKEEEFTRAIALSLFDYLRKSHARGFMVSISGGADSAAVSCLSALQTRLGVGELGLGGYLAKLPHLAAALGGCGSAEAIVGKLLTCVYQSTRNSSTTTREAARTVAKAVGAEFLELDVDPLVESYVELAEGAVGRELTWERDDVALQNVQARVRSPGVWLLANLRGALLLSTSNRSEAAVGYATMDGDTSGGLSPIAGIDKAFLRRWLRWMESEGPKGFGPIPELRAVNVQAPTAELRPPGAGQTDEQDLMPYELLDPIERAAIRDKQTPLEVYRAMHTRFPEVEPRQLATWVERFFRLWCRNQWKRERYAPSFHVDDENLDPKTWCRFPILSGGFEREIVEMWAWVAGE